MNQLEQLLRRIKADARFPVFQTLIVNSDLSVLVVYQHGSKYFRSFGELQAFLQSPAKGVA